MDINAGQNATVYSLQFVVSIPERDFSGYQPSDECQTRVSALAFQSLKGILVDINRRLPLGRQSFRKFQSLKGILVDINFLGFRFDKRQLEFQSLKGILVDINPSR